MCQLLLMLIGSAHHPSSRQHIAWKPGARQRRRSFAHDLSLEFRFGRKQSFVSGGAQGVRAGEVNRQRRLQGLGAEKLVDGSLLTNSSPASWPGAKRDRRCGWAVVVRRRRGRRKGGRSREGDKIKITSGGGVFQAEPSNGLSPKPDFPFAVAACGTLSSCLAHTVPSRVPTYHYHPHTHTRAYYE